MAAHPADHPGPFALVDDLGYDLPTTPLDIETEVSRIDRRVVDLESFFNQIIELERDLGIVGFDPQ